jgi:hypothetical protein
MFTSGANNASTILPNRIKDSSSILACDPDETAVSQADI